VLLPIGSTATDAAIARAIDAITPATLARDLQTIAQPREDRFARGQLERTAQYVQDQLEQAGFQVTRQHVGLEGRSADNVIGERAGSDRSQVVLVGAHYDAVVGSPGADDDGTGVAALLAIARAASVVHTHRMVRVIAFAFEEDGLIGSAHYVDALSPAERARIVGMIDVEMIGYRDHTPGSQHYPAGIEDLLPGLQLPTTGDFVAAVGLEGEALAPVLADARAYVTDLDAEVLEVRRMVLLATPDLLRSDHAPFWLAGIPAVLVGDTADFRNPNYHQPSDTLGTLDLEFASRAARWLAASTLVLAGSGP
jgi:Zn-dependent M28 family amino/carboxypeptidase